MKKNNKNESLNVRVLACFWKNNTVSSSASTFSSFIFGVKIVLACKRKSGEILGHSRATASPDSVKRPGIPDLVQKVNIDERMFASNKLFRLRSACLKLKLEIWDWRLAYTKHCAAVVVLTKPQLYKWRQILLVSLKVAFYYSFLML